MQKPEPVTRVPVLVVDDDPTFLSYITAVLFQHGRSCEVAVTGDQALAMLRKIRVQAVLLDLRLPDRDGVDVLRDIVKDPGHPPVILVSGAASISSAWEAGRLGAAGYLEKPFPSSELLAILDHLSDSSGHQAESIIADADHDRTKIELGSASRRLAEAVVRASHHKSDFKHGRGLSQAANTGHGTMRHWCRIAGVPGRRFVRFARGFWATRQALRSARPPIELLDYLEIETGARILDPALPPGTTVDEYCARQAHLPASHPVVLASLNLMRTSDPAGVVGAISSSPTDSDTCRTRVSALVHDRGPTDGVG